MKLSIKHKVVENVIYRSEKNDENEDPSNVPFQWLSVVIIRGIASHGGVPGEKSERKYLQRFYRALLTLIYPPHFEDFQHWKYQSGVNHIYEG